MKKIKDAHWHNNDAVLIDTTTTQGFTQLSTN